MFAEWTDPHDIDNYYNDLNNLLKEVQPAYSSSVYQQLPVRPTIEARVEPPTGVIVNTLTTSLDTKPSNNKSNFEVKPDSIFLDEHPVGRQPRYNVLRSGPPPKELYCNGNSSEQIGQVVPYIDWTYIIIFIAFVFLVSLVLQTRAQLSNSNMTIRMLIAMISNNQKNQ